MNKSNHMINKSVFVPMNIFANVDTSGAYRLQHLIQSYYLLLWRMTTIVNQYINCAHTCFKALPKFRSFLVTNKHGNIVCFVSLTSILDVHAINMASAAKILPPHLQAATAVNTNFYKLRF